MKGPPPSLRVSTERANSAAQSGDIDSTDNLERQQIYLFHGYNDGTVARSVTDALAKFYASAETVIFFTRPPLEPDMHSS